VDKSQKKKLKWLFAQPEEIIIDTIHKQRKLYHALKKEHPGENSDKLALQALIKIAEQLYSDENLIRRKATEKNLDEIKAKVLQRIRRHRIKHDEQKKEKKKLRNLKKEKIKMLLNEIMIMRKQGLSYKAVAGYIEKYHKLKLHPTYVSKLLNTTKAKTDE
jgi:hypothetical protein